MKRRRVPSKVIKSTKLRGAQHSLELGLKSTEHQKTLTFSALRTTTLQYKVDSKFGQN